jgi:hypothetical protein
MLRGTPPQVVAVDDGPTKVMTFGGSPPAPGSKAKLTVLFVGS